MGRIWKYEFDVTDDFEIEIPVNSTFLTVQAQSGKPVMWFWVNEPLDQKTVKKFKVVGTGHSMDDKLVGYLGTFQLLGGNFVGHLFERV